MATEQQLAQALSPYDPNYLKNLALGQGAPSLLGNTTTVQPKPVNNLALLDNTTDTYTDPNPGWSGKSGAERAAFYGENPAYGTVSKGLQNAFDLTSVGFVQNLVDPDRGMRARAEFSGFNPDLASYSGASFAEQKAMNDALAAQQASNNAAEAGIGSYGGGSFAEQQAMNDALSAQATAQAAQDAANNANAPSAEASGPSGLGTDAGGDGYAKGGRVDRNRLRGPDPRGPDQGYAPLQSGEYVIKRDAVRKYGEGMLGKINSGKFAKK